MKKTLLIACLTSTVGNIAVAAEPSDFEAYLGASHYFWDGDRSLDNATGFDLGGELPVTERLSLDAWLSKVDADVENGSGELEGERYSLGGLYHFADANEDVRPFVSVGAGHQEFESGNNSQDETVAYLGAGLKKYFDNNIVVRGDLLGMNSLDNELTDVAVRLSVGYAFGRSAARPIAKEKVIMAQPTVPEKQEEAVVEPVQKATIAAAIPAKDSDGDGIIDSLDQCLDTDKNYHVDDTGCPVMETETVSIKMNVVFPTNSAEIPAASRSEIKRVADFMQQFKNTSVTVEGHSDDRGRDSYNKTLSQKRADAVRLSLINDFGLNESRVSAMGYGEENPIADNGTAAGRAENRRVVAVVMANSQKPAIK